MKEISEESVRAVIVKARSGIFTRNDFEAGLQRPLVSGLSRWELWALIGFERQERRQKWVGYIVESKLRGAGDELAERGVFGHPEGISQEGEVPDMPDWRYHFHGRGCCLSHSDGTRIDVDFGDDGSAVEIDPFFYSDFLASSPKLDWSDAQLSKMNGNMAEGLLAAHYDEMIRHMNTPAARAAVDKTFTAGAEDFASLRVGVDS